MLRSELFKIAIALAILGVTLSLIGVLLQYISLNMSFLDMWTYILLMLSSFIELFGAIAVSASIVLAILSIAKVLQGSKRHD